MLRLFGKEKANQNIDEVNKECSSIELTSANFRVHAHQLYKSLGFTVKDTRFPF